MAIRAVARKTKERERRKGLKRRRVKPVERQRRLEAAEDLGLGEARGPEERKPQEEKHGKGGVKMAPSKTSTIAQWLTSAGCMAELGVGLYFQFFVNQEADESRLMHSFRAIASLKKGSSFVCQLSRVLHSKRQVFPSPLFSFPDLASSFNPCDVQAFVSASADPLERAVQCWCELVVLFANNLALGKVCVSGSRATAAQRDLMQAIKQSVTRMLKDDCKVVWGIDEIRDDFQKRSVSYTGEEICKAEALSLSRIQPGLPPEGHGASVSTVEWVGGRTRELLLDPFGCLNPDVGQPLPKLQSKVHIVAEERLEVAQELVRRGICRWTHASQVAVYRGERILNGMFGVAKSKLTAKGETVLRVIMNLVPVNSVLRVIPGRVAKLPNIAQWLNVVLDDNETVRIAQSDMACAFYLFEMPLEWSRLLCFNLGFDSATLGLEALDAQEDLWYLSCCVLPMGWSSAVGIMQEIVEAVLLSGGLSAESQIHKTAVLPSWIVNSKAEGSLCGKPWWHVYLDNFAGGAKVTDGDCEELIRLQKHAELLWSEAGIVVSPGKSVVAAESGVELGAFIGGAGQWIGASCERLVNIIKSSLWLLEQPHLSKKKLQIMMGRWCFALQFRRPGMCQFDEVWNYISSKGSSQAQVLKVRSEVLFAILGAPLFHTWLGARIDEVTTCSDASQTGGAVAIARSLTVDGKGFLEIQERTNMPMEVPIVVISLFNGIGGAARCYDVAGVKVRAFLACDIHKPSNRTTARRWPDTIFGKMLGLLPKRNCGSY